MPEQYPPCSIPKHHAEMTERLDRFSSESQQEIRQSTTQMTATIESLKQAIQTQAQTQAKLVDAMQAMQAKLDDIQTQSAGQQLADELISVATRAMDESITAYGKTLQQAANDADARMQQLDSVTNSFTQKCKKHLSAVRSASMTRISNGMAAAILAGVLALNAGITYFVTASFGNRLERVENLAGATWYNATFQDGLQLRPYEWPAESKVLEDQVANNPNGFRRANDVWNWYVNSKQQKQ